MNSEKTLRQSGIKAIGVLSWGSHFCQFYETPDDLIETLVPYFQAGLKNNEFCMWAASKPLPVGAAKRALLAAMPNAEERIKRGQLEILDYSEWYTKSGKFEAGRALVLEIGRRFRERGAGSISVIVPGDAGFWKKMKFRQTTRVMQAFPIDTVLEA